MINEILIPQLHVRSNLKSGVSGGGYVDGVWYPDQSGVCGTTTPPVNPQPPTPLPMPPTAGGGYVGGKWYPDQSGACG